MNGLDPHFVFVEHAKSNRALLSRETFSCFDESPFLNDPVQGWPTFLAAGLVRQVHEDSLALFDAARGFIRHACEYDPKRVEAFFRYDELRERNPRATLSTSEDMAASFRKTEDARHAVYRSDVILTDEGPAIIELNCSGGIGGWESAFINQLTRGIAPLSEYLESLGDRLQHTEVTESYFDFIIREAPPRHGVATYKVAFYVDIARHGDPLFQSFGTHLLNEALKRSGYDQEGHVVMISADSIVEDGDGSLHVDDDLCAVQELQGLPNEEKYHQLRLRCPRPLLIINGPPVSCPMTDKRLLAELSKRADHGELPWGDGEALARVVPWTRLLERGSVRFRGSDAPLEGLVAGREHWVLKRGISWGGQDVIVGRETSASDWETAVSAAFESGDWVVQERRPSVPLEYQLGPHGCAEAHTVFGFFSFGRRYGGGFARILPRTGSSVVNAHQGSQDGAVFLVE